MTGEAIVPVLAAVGDLSGKAQAIAVVVTVLLFGLVVELVRRRRLVERYALIWMFAATVLVVLAVWDGGLGWIGDRLGIIAPANTLFLLGLAAVFGLALHFSIAISRLSEETKILAQEAARLDAELRLARGEQPRSNGAVEADSPSAQPQERRAAAPSSPSSLSTTDQ